MVQVNIRSLETSAQIDLIVPARPYINIITAAIFQFSQNGSNSYFLVNTLALRIMV